MCPCVISRLCEVICSVSYKIQAEQKGRFFRVGNVGEYRYIYCFDLTVCVCVM